MPRAEHNPPIPRIPSSHEKILRTPTVITYELVCCHQLPSVLQPSALCTEIGKHSYSIDYFFLPQQQICVSTLQKGVGRLRSQWRGFEIRDRARSEIISHFCRQCRMIGQAVVSRGERKKIAGGEKSCCRGSPAFVSYELASSQLILPLMIKIFCGSPGTRTTCIVVLE